MGTFRREPEEMRLLAREAYALWRDLAVERANPYGDHAMCLVAGRMALEATRWEDGLVILEAIRTRMDGKSSPRRIPEWARELGGDKRRTDHNARMAEERAMWTEIDPEVRRVMAGILKAKARGDTVSLDAVTCIECRQFTETKCESCLRPVHARGCRLRHNAACLPAAPEKGSDHGEENLHNSIRPSGSDGGHADA